MPAFAFKPCSLRRKHFGYSFEIPIENHIGNKKPPVLWILIEDIRKAGLFANYQSHLKVYSKLSRRMEPKSETIPTSYLEKKPKEIDPFYAQTKRDQKLRIKVKGEEQSNCQDSVKIPR